MNCERFEALLTDYLEGTLTGEDRADMEKHAKECPACAQSLEDMRLLLQDMASLDSNAQVPADWMQNWREAVYREEKSMMQQQTKEVQKKKSWRTWVSVAAAAVVLVTGSIAARDMVPATGNGGNKSDIALPQAVNDESAKMYSAAEYESASPGVYYDTAMGTGGAERSSLTADAAMSKGTAGTNSEGGDTVQGIKIIRTASYSLATMQFEKDLAALKALAASLNGWVEYADVTGDTTVGETRYASLTLRIPTGSLADFKNGVNQIGRVTGSNETATDVSESYADTQMRLATQKTKMERLQKLMETTGELADLLAVENEIANTQYQIDSYESSLRSTDNQVNFTSISVYLKEETAGEAATVKTLTLFERIQKGFVAAIAAIGAFFQDLVVFLAMVLPILIPLALVIFIIVKVRKRHTHAKQQ